MHETFWTTKHYKLQFLWCDLLLPYTMMNFFLPLNSRSSEASSYIGLLICVEEMLNCIAFHRSDNLQFFRKSFGRLLFVGSHVINFFFILFTIYNHPYKDFAAVAGTTAFAFSSIFANGTLTLSRPDDGLTVIQNPSPSRPDDRSTVIQKKSLFQKIITS